jgi:hypothetical protein
MVASILSYDDEKAGFNTIQKDLPIKSLGKENEESSELSGRK